MVHDIHKYTAGQPPKPRKYSAPRKKAYQPTKLPPRDPDRSLRNYLPEGVLEEFPDLEAPQHYFLHLLHTRRVYSHRKPDAYIRLNKTLLRKQLGKRHAGEGIEKLIDLGIVEKSPDGYVKGRHCIGYRLTERYRYRTHRLHFITDKGLLKRLKKYHKRPVKLCDHYADLFGVLKTVKIDADAARAYAHKAFKDEMQALKGIDTSTATRKRKKLRWRLSQQLYSIEMIATGDFFLIPCRYGRIHTNVTNLSEPLRQFLTIGDAKLAEIDVKCSQPLLLTIHYILTNHTTTNTTPHQQYPYVGKKNTCTVNEGELPKDVLEFKRLSENGKLYEVIAKDSGLTVRKEAKVAFYRMVFDRPKASPLDDLFPTVVAFADSIKRECYKDLATTLQRLEGDIIVRTAALALRKRNVPILTIHDSILCKADDVLEAMREVLAAFAGTGVTPSLKQKGYGRA